MAPGQHNPWSLSSAFKGLDVEGYYDLRRVVLKDVSGDSAECFWGCKDAFAQAIN